ncbi:hypothetical protein H9L39_01126 [Fusarium oxysporum f. sp. albedinis]|nr:hypothetical protein H9L39_01126 [Fusarium oxysporum f. sp. albedinis]
MPMPAKSAQYTVRTLPLVEAEPHRRPLRMPNEDGYRRTCIPLHCGPPPLAATYQPSKAEMRRRRLVAIRIPHKTNDTAEAGFHVVVSCSQNPIIYKRRPQRPNRFASVDFNAKASPDRRMRGNRDDKFPH